MFFYKKKEGVDHRLLSNLRIANLRSRMNSKEISTVAITLFWSSYNNYSDSPLGKICCLMGKGNLYYIIQWGRINFSKSDNNKCQFFNTFEQSQKVCEYITIYCHKGRAHNQPFPAFNSKNQCPVLLHNHMREENHLKQKASWLK